jgi:hypothetical protein
MQRTPHMRTISTRLPCVPSEQVGRGLRQARKYVQRSERRIIADVILRKHLDTNIGKRSPRRDSCRPERVNVPQAAEAPKKCHGVNEAIDKDSLRD